MNEYKKFNREIKGYVDVIYNTMYSAEINLFYYDTMAQTINVPKKIFSQDINVIKNNFMYKPEFAILRENYTKLDGSKILFQRGLNRSGFISDITPSEIETFDDRNVIFDFQFEEKTYGITFYFRENTIKNANVILYRRGEANPDTLTIENNTKENFFIDTSQDDYDHIIVETLEWTRPDLPIWIENIHTGISHRYKGNELIEFEVTEQVNKLVEETPSNELKLTIGDYERLYDPLNPKGITKYLTEEAQFIPYIGIVTENGSIEYIKMGTFYFNKIDYSENEITFTCYNYMDKLSKQKIKNESNTLNPVEQSRYQPTIMTNGLFLYLKRYIDYNLEKNFEINISNKIRMINSEFKDVSLANFFQNATIIDGIFYIDRDEKIIIRKVDKEVKNIISKNDLLRDIKYINVPKIDKIELELNEHSISATSGTNNKDNFSYEFVLEKETQTICIYSDDITNIYGIGDNDLIVTGATSYRVICPAELGFNVNNYIIFINVTGEIGSNVSIRGRYNIPRTATYNRVTRTYGEGKNIIQMDNPFYNGYLNPIYDDATFSNFFDKTYSYKVDLEYNGDPTIQAGDYIEVESNYGMVPIFVQKHTLKYNGGLSGTIEGVE